MFQARNKNDTDQIVLVHKLINASVAMRGSRGGGGDRGLDPPGKSQKYLVSWQYWSGSSKNYKATKSASIECWAIIGLPGKHHLNGVSLVGRWWPAYSGPLIVVFGSSLPSSTKKTQNVLKVGPPLTKLSGSGHGCSHIPKIVFLTISCVFFSYGCHFERNGRCTSAAGQTWLLCSSIHKMEKMSSWQSPMGKTIL